MRRGITLLAAIGVVVVLGAAAALNPKPRDLTDGAYMTKLSDQYLHDVISKGGPAMGKSPAMPPWNPTLKDADIQNVVAYLRSLTRR